MNRKSYLTLGLAILIVACGFVAVLIVQPAPPAYAEGWSEALSVSEASADAPPQMAIDDRDRLHLLWHRRDDRASTVWTAQMDAQGTLVTDPKRLSDLGVKAEGASLAQIGTGIPLAFWIEKGHEDGLQRLVMARLADEPEVRELSRSPKIMRDLAVTTNQETNQVFVAWSDSRTGLYEIYICGLDGQGQERFLDRPLTESGTDFVLRPVLAAAGDTLHLLYLSDKVIDIDLMVQTYTLDGEPVSAPRALESMSQSAVSLGGNQGGPQDRTLIAVAGGDGTLSLYEAMGPAIQYRPLGGPVRTILSGDGPYSHLQLVPDATTTWMTWTGSPGSRGDRLQVYVGQWTASQTVEHPSRVTYRPNSALWPALALDSRGEKHLLWLEGTGNYRYQLFYANTLTSSPPTGLERLGFVRGVGGWSLALAVAEGLLLGLITTVLRIWRAGLAWGVAAGVLLVAWRTRLSTPNRQLLVGLFLCAALVALAQPEAQTLGQSPIAVSPAAHWAMIAFATLLTGFLGWTWREALRSIWTWAGLAGIWFWGYYWLNVVLILREGFAI
jgi:hypothetical protein